jgi:PIN domain nuclease of toxin-antitoxin system
LADLTIKPEHKNTNDHQIISQAITEKIPLISSDEDFVFYENQGLNFIFKNLTDS